MPLQDLQNTLQVFLSTGEDVEESSTNCPLTSSRLMGHILNEPSDQNTFFAFVISTIGPGAFDDDRWANLLYKAAVYFGPPFHNKALAILPFCNQKVPLKALMRALYRIRTLPNKNQLQNFRILFERAEGLTLFSCVPPFGSLIHLASRSSYKFALLQHIFKSLQSDKKDLIPPDVEIQDQGWTGQKLGVLFTYPAIPFSECKPSREFIMCEKCNYMFESSQVRNDVPWQQKVQRFKDGLDPDGPLTEKERQEQEEWKGYVEAEKEGICKQCHRDSLEEKHQQEVYGLGLNYFTC